MKIVNTVTGRTNVVGIIGNPVAHSISPQLHNTISKLLGQDIIYVPFKVDKSDLEDAVKGLKALNILGFNVTLPYKRDIMKYIDDNIRETFLMGAINTVKNIDGRFYGYNTDAEGFLRAFKEEFDTGFKDKNITIIGAGGTARPIAVKAAIDGAKKISIVNRTVSKSIEIAEVVNENIKEIVQVYNFNDKTFDIALSESDVVINTTSLGMYPGVDLTPFEKKSYFRKGQLVFDVIYNPVETRFLREARESGCKTCNGLKMLFYQGIYAYEIWTGLKLQEDLLKEVYISFKKILSK